MKNLFKSALVVLIGLSSCQQEGVNTSIDPAQAEASNLREAALSTNPSKYQLIKHGDNKLSYTQDGRLQKVTYGPAQRGVVSIYALYKYGAHTISSTVYYDNKIVQVSTYSLDDTGKCFESKQVDYIPYGPNIYVEKESSFTYLYNAKSQLTTRTNKKALTEKTTFIWDAAGDLTKMTGYNFQNGRAYESMPSTSTLYYDQPTGDPVLTDFSPVNCEAANLPDEYLMIFGKQSKHLLKMISEQSSPGGKYYSYTLNPDGYVTKRQTYEVSGAALIETKSYEYLVTALVVNL